MPVELRKRKAPAPAPAPEPPAKKQSKVTKAAAKVKKAVKGKSTAEHVGPPKTNGAKAEAKALAPAPAPKKPEVGDTIDLAAFGGEVTLNDGTTTTLASLVEKSGSGVVLFTYPKASTPGCTNQVCLFRDSYEPLTAGGLAIYGLSRDSPKSNTSFKDKQKLPYPLLCDPKGGLIEAIGLKKAPSSTQRGVFVVDKEGKVLLAEPGSPAGTVSAVKKLVESQAVNGGATDGEEKEEEEEEKEEKEEKKDEEKNDKKEEKKEEKEEEKKEDKKEEKKDEGETDEKDEKEQTEEKTNGASAEEAKAGKTEEKE